jgi:hypothetical protein
MAATRASAISVRQSGATGYVDAQFALIDEKISSLTTLTKEWIAALEKVMDARFDAEGIARDLAAQQLREKLMEMNEVRAQLGTQRAEFATNEKLEALAITMRTTFAALTDQIAASAALLRTTTNSDMTQLRERVDRDLKSINDDIRILRDYRSAQGGEREQVHDTRDVSRENRLLIFGIGGCLAALVAAGFTALGLVVTIGIFVINQVIR